MANPMHERKKTLKLPSAPINVLQTGSLEAHVLYYGGSIMVKVRLTVSVPSELIRWMDEEISKGHFAERSHTVQ